MKPAEAEKIKKFLRSRLNLRAVKDKDTVLERITQSVQICEDYFKGRFVCVCVIGSSLSKSRPPNDIDILCLVSNLNEENDRNSLSRYITSQNKGDTLFVYDNEPPKNPKNPMVEITLAPAPNLSDAKKVVAEIRANKSLNSKKKTFFKEVVFGRFVGQMLFFYGNRNYFSELVEVVVMALETLLGIKSAQLDIKSSISPNFIEVNLT